MNFSYYQKSGFIFCTSGNFDEIRIFPKKLRFYEIDPVLPLVSLAFTFVKFKFHSR